MKKILTAPIQLWHLVVVAILVSTLTSTVVVSAASPSAFLPAGTVRMTVASGKDSAPVTVPSGYTSVTVLQQAITVPVGKVADVVVLGEVDMEGGGTTGYQYCFGQIRLDNIATGAQFQPGNYILEGFNPPANNLSVPINGYLPKVPAGNHTIYMVMQAGYHDCIALNRSMIILANLR